MTEHVVTQHHRETHETNACPPDYWSTGGSSSSCELINPSSDPRDPVMGGPKGRPDRINVGTHVSSTSETFTETDYTWSEVEWQHRVFSKLGKRPELDRASRYALVEVRE